MSRKEKAIKAVQDAIRHPKRREEKRVIEYMKTKENAEEQGREILLLYKSIHQLTKDNGKSLATANNPNHPGITLVTGTFRSIVYTDSPQITVSTNHTKTNRYGTHIMLLSSGYIQMHLFREDIFPAIRKRPTTPLQSFATSAQFGTILEALPESLPVGHQLFVKTFLTSALSEIHGMDSSIEVVTSNAGM